MKYICALIPLLLSVDAVDPGTSWVFTPVVIDGVFGSREWTAQDKVGEMLNGGGTQGGSGTPANFAVADVYLRYKCDTNVACIAVRMKNGFTLSGTPGDDENFVTSGNGGSGKLTPFTTAVFPNGQGWEGCFPPADTYNVFGKFCSNGVCSDESMRITGARDSLTLPCTSTGGETHTLPPGTALIMPSTVNAI